MISFDKQDETLLLALTHDVRLLTAEQARRLLDCSIDESQAIGERLSGAGYVSVESQLISIDGEATQPTYSWDTGAEIPNFRSAAYLFRKRWNNPREEKLLFPTAKACSLYGGSMTRPRSQGETDHDLWMSEVYLLYRERELSESNLSWVSGDELRSSGEARRFAEFNPDACLCRSNGEVVRIVEGAGKGYQASKLSRIHDSYSQHSPYEVW